MSQEGTVQLLQDTQSSQLSNELPGEVDKESPALAYKSVKALLKYGMARDPSFVAASMAGPIAVFNVSVVLIGILTAMELEFEAAVATCATIAAGTVDPPPGPESVIPPQQNF